MLEKYEQKKEILQKRLKEYKQAILSTQKNLRLFELIELINKTDDFDIFAFQNNKYRYNDGTPVFIWGSVGGFQNVKHELLTNPYFEKSYDHAKYMVNIQSICISCAISKK